MWRYGVFALWIVTTAALGARLAGLHLIPLPRPTRAIQSTGQTASSVWSLTHILAVDCPCSLRIADHLLARGTIPDASEQVWILGPDADLARRLADRGFQVSTVDPDQLAAETGIQGGPWLLIRNPAGAVVYSGGYAPQPLHDPAEARDLELLAKVRQGQRP
ncbi:MAG TPA: hypothetical protein VL992_08975, partial [Tepidisphaeraceae bacterium]|nr:hypothetical protein [Tepidisphaeraceae bacterium]